MSTKYKFVVSVRGIPNDHRLAVTRFKSDGKLFVKFSLYTVGRNAELLCSHIEQCPNDDFSFGADFKREIQSVAEVKSDYEVRQSDLRN